MAAQKTVYRNSEVKSRVNERLSMSVLESGKVIQSIVKNSKNKDIIHQATKQFSNLDSSLTNMEQNLNNIEKMIKKMEVQKIAAEHNLQAIQQMAMKLHEI
ncbi:uncharacterized protein LOC135695866 [Rhopilema esculentum]|uniref:uncharacterized protein LOC135695866 n=1 Tax=Rhopilema esculentum TaxID=499914 RepID=UPI0031DA502F